MKPITGICVDGWCSGNPGPGGYRAVNIETGDILFEWEANLITNNLAEFIGLYHAILWRDKYMPDAIIWSDSNTAMAWVKHKKVNTTFNLNRSPAVKGRIQTCLDGLQLYKVGINFSYYNIQKWETKVWGEIPADLGRK